MPPPVSPDSRTPPRAKQRYTVAQVATAVLQSRGLLTGAARALQCDPSTVRNYAARYPSVAAAIVEAREAMLDVAEASLFKEVAGGEGWAVKYYLSTQGKRRGYVERVEQTGPDGGPQQQELTVRVVYADVLPLDERTP